MFVVTSTHYPSTNPSHSDMPKNPLHPPKPERENKMYHKVPKV